MGDDRSLTDITGKKHPDVLKEQNMLQTVLGAMNCGMSVQDPDYTVIYLNDYTINLLGNRIGEKCYRVFENRDSICDGCPVELAFKDGQSHTTIREIVLPSGEVAFFENTANPIRDASGKIISCLEIARNITDRKQAEDALRESGKLYKELLDASPAVIYRCETSNPYPATFISPNIINQMGYKPEDFTGDPTFWSNHIHPDDKPRVFADLALLFEEGSHKHEYRFLQSDGTYHWVYDELTLICDVDGRPVDIIGNWINITERKQIEERLRKSEEQLSLIYDSVGDALYSLAVEPDDCFRFLSINQAFLDITGLLENQIIGKRIEEVIPEPSVCTVRDNYKKAIEKKRIFRWEETSEYPAGVKVGEVSIAPVFNDNGICIFLVGAVHDITDRKRAEEDLRKSEERFRKFTEISPVGIFITDRDGKTVYWNEQLCKITSMSPEDGMGTGWADGIHPEDRERVSKEWYGSAEARSTFKSEYRFVDRSGKVTHAIGQAVALHDSENEITGYVGTITDITARRQLENEVLKISAREQRRIGLELHDGLGQQLTGVSFMMKALEQKLANAGVPEYADVTRLSEYLRDMVRLTRDISQGLCPVGIDDRGLMTGLEKLADHVIDTYGISCRFTCGGNIKLKDTDVATHLYRIAQEAVTNAVKHGKTQTIELNLTETDGRISLTIKDDGVGFSPQTENPDGLGVKIMRYRANVIGATFSIMSGKPAGTVIECQIATKDAAA